MFSLKSSKLFSVLLFKSDHNFIAITLHSGLQVSKQRNNKRNLCHVFTGGKLLQLTKCK